MSDPTGARRGAGVWKPSWREALWACLGAMLLAAIPMRDVFLEPSRVVFGVDCGTSQLPWSAEIDAPTREGLQAPRNKFLSDQSKGFYPFYRWVSESWRRGDPPLWNPLIFAGVPGVGNPQTGAFDPQVLLLVALDAIGGKALFDWGLGFTSWLRLAAAGLGAYLLARRLGLARAGAALSATTFSLSGYVVLWLGFSLAHVAVALPWLVYFLEGTRGERPRLATVGVAFSACAAILGGHPETSFYVGTAGFLWALGIARGNRRAGGYGVAGLVVGALLSAPLVLPFLDYLRVSASQQLRAAGESGGAIDFIALAILTVVAGGLAMWRREAERDESQDTGNALRAFAVFVPGVLLLGGWWALAQRGLPSMSGSNVFFDLYGAPGPTHGGYRGEGLYLEEASGWILPVSLALAMAASLSAHGVLRMRGLAMGIAWGAFLLCLRAPGLLDLYRWVPAVGLGATVRAGSVSALFLGLLAGDGLLSARRGARLAAVFGLLIWAGWVHSSSAVANPNDDVARGPETGAQFGLFELPPAELGNANAPLSGWIHGSLPVQSLHVAVTQVDREGRELGGTRWRVPAEIMPEFPARFAGRDDVPAGAIYFHCPHLSGQHLTRGLWRFSVVFAGASPSEVFGERRVCVSRVDPRPRASDRSLLLAAVSWILVALATGPRWRWIAVGLGVVQGLAFASGMNPSVSSEEAFRPTSTTTAIAREIGALGADSELRPGRFASDVGVLPPSTGMVFGLRHIDGYDGLEVAEYNEWRQLALRPGVSALLDWNPRGIELQSEAAQLLGLQVLATRAPLPDASADHWELVSGAGDATSLYRRIEPAPAVFAVPRIQTPEAISASIETWRASHSATYDGEWRPEEVAIDPAKFAEQVRVLSGPDWTNNTYRVRVQVPGPALLVIPEQAFEGWSARVNGADSELGTANGIFRGVPLLSGGEHDVELVYAPRSLRLGYLMACIGGLVLLAFALRSRS